MNCGYVALIGRPNVGKSTLMNYLLKQKISITSRKPQTTRHRILGINTTEKGQAIYIDTPGMHGNAHRALNRYLNRAADMTLTGVDVVVWLIDKLAWQEFDNVIFEKLLQVEVPVILAVNKADRIEDKERVLPFFASAQARFPFSAMLPISALKNIHLTELENLVFERLPESALIYPADQVTDRSERFLVSEMIREKLMRHLGAELPYELTVEVERYEELPHLTKIYALIWTERDSQKSIIIGSNGEMLKKVGTQAREDIERMLEKKVYLELWVKVKKGWADDERALQRLGFTDL